MKLSTTKAFASRKSWWVGCFIILVLFSGCKKWDPDPPFASVTTAVTGLTNPMGIDVENNGTIWVSEGETFNNNGKVWVISPNGRKYEAIIKLPAFKNKLSGEPQGTSHLLLDNDWLYVLSGDYLYRIDVSRFKPGKSMPIDASKLAYEDVGAFIYSKKYPDSHAYNLSKGPNGDIYIADAGANVIIHRHGWNNFSILAEIPGFKNPTPVGPPEIQSVPTSVFWDGHDFLVTTLTGFPFVKGLAVIYKVSVTGQVSIYQKGLTLLVDMAQGKSGFQIAVQYGTFGPTGFDHNTGALTWVNGNLSIPMVNGLDMPVGIVEHKNNTWYVTCMGDGTVKKITYH